MVQSIRSLRIFVTVAEELHFRKAAERLHMTQPPLSLHIKQLEDSIGVDLFSRTTRSVQLTPAGKELQQRATRFLAELEAMTEAVRCVGNGAVGALSLGFPTSTMFDLLPRLLEMQRSKYPQVSLVLKEQTSIELLEQLRARKLDAALVRAATTSLDPDLDYVVASEESLLLAMPQNHPLARNPSVSIQTLNKIPFIGFSAEGSRYFKELTESVFKTYGVQPDQVQESVLPTILALVEARLGVALVPESMARLKTNTLTYRAISDVKEIRKIPLYCAWRQSDVPPPVENFIAIVERCHAASVADPLVLDLAASRFSESLIL
jgi:DNA-binding transcriptional LysR family regulator